MEKFNVIYEQWWELTLEVDPTKVENFKQQLEFWSGGKHRIKKEKGDVKIAFLKMLAEEIIVMSMTMNTFGICKEFEEKEGWLPLTIENGVKIIEMDCWNFDQDDFFVQKLE